MPSLFVVAASTVFSSSLLPSIPLVLLLVHPPPLSPHRPSPSTSPLARESDRRAYTTREPWGRFESGSRWTREAEGSTGGLG